MDIINLPPPAVHRIAWQRRRVRGSGGKLFNEAVILARDGVRCYLLLRLLAHDKPHVATMLACRVREDRVSGIMVQEPDAHVVIKVRAGSRRRTPSPPSRGAGVFMSTRRPPPCGQPGTSGAVHRG